MGRTRNTKKKKAVYNKSPSSPHDAAYAREQRIRAAASRDSYRRLKYNYNPPNFDENDDEQDNEKSDKSDKRNFAGNPEFFK